MGRVELPQDPLHASNGGTAPHSWRGISTRSLGFALFLFLFTASAFQIFSHDVWWHLASGEWILNHNSIPRVDPFSSTVAGVPWVDHEWATQILLDLIENIGGIPSLVGLRVLFVFLIAGVLIFSLARRGAGPLQIALLVALAVQAGRLRLQVRPELVTLLLVTFLVSLCIRGRWSPKSLWISVLFLPWVNLHGGFLMGLAVLGCHAIGGLGDRILEKKREKPSGPEDLRLRWSVLLLATGATLINPYGVHIYSVLGQIGETLVSSGLLSPEWRPPHLTMQPLFFVLALALAALTILAARYMSLSTVLISAMMLVYALSFSRGTAFLCLSFPLLAWEAFAALRDSGHPRWQRVAAAVAGRPRAEWLAAGLLLAAAAAHTASTGLPRFGFGVDQRFKPVWAAEFLARERPSPELYNEIGDGGYLMWRLFPDYPVFLDGRLEIYSDLLPEWSRAQADPELWNEFLARYGVKTAVVRYVPMRPGHPPRPVGPLTHKLFASRQWALVYFDDHNMIYLRRDESQAATIARLEYRCLHPESLVDLLTRATADQELAECLQTELDRRQREEPPSTLVKQLTRRLSDIDR